jgi:pimeloyl-ACP methyl ester carboxylesterase
MRVCFDRCFSWLAILVFALAVSLAGRPASAGVDPANLCKDKKAKGTGKKTVGILKSFGKNLKVPNTAKLADDISKAQSKFTKDFSNADGVGSCPGTAASVESMVDNFAACALCQLSQQQETVAITSAAEPDETPGSPVVNHSYPDLVTQFGALPDLNKATYTRYFCGESPSAPDAILILVPGFEGGAASFKLLAENALAAGRARGLALEVWAFDRRGHQLEDREGIRIAQAAQDGMIALDWAFGGELGLALNPELLAGPNRRAIFHDGHADTAFIANWTPLMFSRDIDAVVEVARAVATNQNVFLGGHSAGTGFLARYAATDFDLTGGGPAEPGYVKLRGLVLLEGGGGSTAAAPSADTLARIEDKADGGLFHAVRTNVASCVDGTPCTIATEATVCAGKGNERCTEPTTAYPILTLGPIPFLNPRILMSAEVVAVQGLTDPDSGEALLTVDQGAPGNNPVAVVPDLSGLATLGKTTVEGGLGRFLDDDGTISSLATFIRTSLGAAGPTVGGVGTWLDIDEGPFLPAILPNNGPAPTALPAGVWGQEVEPSRMDRVRMTFINQETNFTDWYYPSSGLTTTSVSGKCSGLAGTCTVGNVPAACSGGTQAVADATCSQSLGLDSSALSVTEGRRDIENLTQAANVNLPVICFGGSNGLTTVSGVFVPYAQTLGTCTAPSCTGSTPRVVNASVPNPAFPTFGDVNGGFEVYISEGYAHVDIVTAEDAAHNNVIEPLLDFLERNVQ